MQIWQDTCPCMQQVLASTGVVPFPQDGIYGQPQNEELLQTALQMGADVVRVIPPMLRREDGVK